MHIQRKTTFLIAALALTGTFASAVARADATEAKTLRGIDRIKVVIKLFPPPEFKDTGVTEQVLRPLIESELQKSGIRVVDGSDLDAPELFVFLNALRTNPSTLTTGQSHSYALTMALKQSVTLARDSNVKADAAKTWEQSALGIVPSQNFADRIQDDIRLFVWTFLKDFQSVNPK
jgi:hypothetical protein